MNTAISSPTAAAQRAAGKALLDLIELRGRTRRGPVTLPDRRAGAPDSDPPQLRQHTRPQ